MTLAAPACPACTSSAASRSRSRTWRPCSPVVGSGNWTVPVGWRCDPHRANCSSKNLEACSPCLRCPHTRTLPRRHAVSAPRAPLAEGHARAEVEVVRDVHGGAQSQLRVEAHAQVDGARVRVVPVHPVPSREARAKCVDRSPLAGIARLATGNRDRSRYLQSTQGKPPVAYPAIQRQYPSKS